MCVMEITVNLISLEFHSQISVKKMGDNHNKGLQLDKIRTDLIPVKMED